MRVVVANEVELALSHVNAFIAEAEVRAIRSANSFIEILPWTDSRHRRGDCGDGGDGDDYSNCSRAAAESQRCRHPSEEGEHNENRQRMADTPVGHAANQCDQERAA